MSFGTTFADAAADGLLTGVEHESNDVPELQQYSLKQLNEIAKTRELGDHDPLAVFQSLQSEFRHLPAPVSTVCEASDRLFDLLRGTDLLVGIGEERWDRWRDAYQQRIDEYGALRGLLARLEERLARLSAPSR